MMADIPIDPRRIRPIGLDGDNGEAVVPNEFPGDGGARPIELGRSMGRLAEKHNLSVAEAGEAFSEMISPLGRGAGARSGRQEPL
jgi:hypothetical protein